MAHETKRLRFPTLSLALLGWLMIGCGAADPSKELVDARRTYEAARQGKAPELVPDKLLEAKQALERAEAAHQDDPGSRKEKTLAYVAQRAALQTMSTAEISAAQRELLAIDQEYKDKQDELRRNAEKQAAETAASLKENQAALRQVRDKLSEQGNKLSASAEELKKKEEELKKRQDELQARQREIEESNKKLAEERAARLEAEKKAAAAMASLREIARVQEEKRGMVITLEGSVLFASGKSALLPIAKNKLGPVAAVLQEQDPNKKIVVEGHTDSIGTEANNQKLSQARADAVREFLVSGGVESHRISAIGKGEAEPIADNKSPEGRANNRRVEIIIK